MKKSLRDLCDSIKSVSIQILVVPEVQGKECSAEKIFEKINRGDKLKTIRKIEGLNPIWYIQTN